jgi:hypothetical protein
MLTILELELFRMNIEDIDEDHAMEEVRRQNLINHLQKCTSLSEVKKLAKMHKAKKNDFLRKLETEKTLSNVKKGELPVAGHRTTTG